MSIISCLTLEKIAAACDAACSKLEAVAEERVNFNKNNKNNKNNVQIKEKELRDKRNHLEEVKKNMKKKHDENNKSEGEVMKKHGKVYLVKNFIERNILKCYKVFKARHHGGDLESHSVCNLMKYGDDIFEKTSACLIEQNEEGLIGD